MNIYACTFLVRGKELQEYIRADDNMDIKKTLAKRHNVKENQIELLSSYLYDGIL